MFFIELWSGSLKTNMYFMIFTEHGHSILWPWKWVTSTYVLLFKYNCLIEQISTYSEKKIWCTLYALNWNMYMNAMESSMFAKLYNIINVNFQLDTTVFLIWNNFKVRHAYYLFYYTYYLYHFFHTNNEWLRKRNMIISILPFSDS